MNGHGRRSLVLLVCFVLLGTAGCYYPGAEVPYVQTPAEVVTEMLRLAGVNGNDLVYDLGSGDGRLVIAAARDFGARGVGIEIDSRLVAQSAESARRAGVADRVKFRAADLFDTDLSDATVVTLYLSPELNLRLRPKLLRELRPGSRIVSHDFPMGDWTPQQTISVPTRDRVSKVFLWIVPPSTAGAAPVPLLDPRTAAKTRDLVLTELDTAEPFENPIIALINVPWSAIR